MSDKKREEFEDWYWGRYGEAFECTRDEAFERDTDGYHENEHARGLFDAWQASRATQVVELSTLNVQHASYNNVDCYAIIDIRKRLTDAGISYS